MSALVTPALLMELEQQRHALDPYQRCRFCDCTNDRPCMIPVREGENGTYYLARTECETTEVIACSWFLPQVCSRPECIEKLLLESRNKVRLFDGTGRRMG